ncbi:FKBP-type peptidyl-prolyl cis-trans isomerase [Capnocytophaga sp. oral taxon 324]|uniref:FKBP-type peptidyl-prolyl cis-trans isomerase n=1 Tax=Capnocytophaga sp. oral taxon 324 TaxID=712211 RepID=UPI0002A288A4|nr:FKBP-type peptidyl-prolyl cis-trans isomerase [Capnocytophaga sp. oral taxon 324]EKY17250.1 peptidyl-prolyl cis-trans isomerase, FKBP-type [Capnocytophaga sp. oral taxon 324 str. F0483]
MMNKFIFAISTIGLLFAVSCKKNENSNVTPPRDVTEVRNENNQSIETFLKTHTYTFSATTTISETVTFATTSNTTASIFNDSKLKRLELDVYDANNTLVRHTLYYLILQEGTGTTTTIADSVYVNYKGQLLDLSVFDETTTQSTSNWMDLIGNIVTNKPSGTIRGFREGVAQLRASATGLTNNSDGTLNAPTDGGVGVFFIPSGLGYFNNRQAKIPAYSPLIFTVRLIATRRADHDHDGKPSINEIVRNEYGVITYPDCDANKDTSYLPDYLDADCK